MRYEDEYFQNSNPNDIWQRYCGFLSLSLDEFCHIQQGLLKEQIGFLADKTPVSTMEEFRRVMPLTRYEHYEPLLQEGHVDLLGEKPFYWVHTSASRGTFKKVPWASRFNTVQRRNIISSFILSSAEESGDIKVSLGSRVLHLLPGRPFASASLAYGLVEQFSIRAIPPLVDGESMTFAKRIDMAMAMGLRNNVDYVIAMTSSVIRMGQRFDDVWQRMRHNWVNILKLHPQVAWRLLSRRRHENILPVDAWALKGIVTWGADSEELSATIEKQWGRKPVQMYGSSEGGIMAMQDWHKGAMAFLPDAVFFEFIPEESINSSNPQTVLIDEVKEGQAYELVISNFYGMPFARYRQGDLVRIVRGDADNGGVPRMVFLGRADDVIDLFGISRINTGVLVEALNKIGLSSENWCLHKNYDDGRIFLDIFVESGPEVWIDGLDRSLNRAIRSLDRHWGEAVFTMAYNPIRIKLIPCGTFLRLGFQNNGNLSVRFNPPEPVLKELGRIEEVGA